MVERRKQFVVSLACQGSPVCAPPPPGKSFAPNNLKEKGPGHVLRTGQVPFFWCQSCSPAPSEKVPYSKESFMKAQGSRRSHWFWKFFNKQSLNAVKHPRSSAKKRKSNSSCRPFARRFQRAANPSMQPETSRPSLASSNGQRIARQSRAGSTKAASPVSPSSLI